MRSTQGKAAVSTLLTFCPLGPDASMTPLDELTVGKGDDEGHERSAIRRRSSL